MNAEAWRRGREEDPLLTLQGIEFPNSIFPSLNDFFSLIC